MLFKQIVNGQKTSTQLQTQAVEKGTIVSAVSASGQMLNANIVNITTQATGTMKQVFVAEGDIVTLGQKIAEVELDSQGQQKSATAWSSYLSAKNSLQGAYSSQLTLHSQMVAAEQLLINDAQTKRLNPGDPLYMQEYESQLVAEAKYNSQQSAIEQAQVNLNNAWLSWKDSSSIVTAPAAGVISGINVAAGMTVGSSTASAASTAGNSQAIIASIRNGNNPLASFNFSEVDISKVKTGQKATIILDSISGKTFTGQVVSIDRIGSINSNVTNYPVVIRFDSEALDALPNMTATASVILETKADVLLIPSTAIQTQGNLQVVKVLKDGKENTVPVETGLSSDIQTEILSGLNEGDQVVTATINQNSTSTSGKSVFGGSIFGGGTSAGSIRRIGQ